MAVPKTDGDKIRKIAADQQKLEQVPEWADEEFSYTIYVEKP